MLSCTFSDIDECSEGACNDVENSTCVNSPGGYNCTCTGGTSALELDAYGVVKTCGIPLPPLDLDYSAINDGFALHPPSSGIISPKDNLVLTKALCKKIEHRFPDCGKHVRYRR